MPVPSSLQPLYLITEGGKLRKEGTLVDRVGAALRGARGAIGFVQLREKGRGEVGAASVEELSTLVPELRALCDLHGAALLLNGSHDPRTLGLTDSEPAARYPVDGVQVGGSVEAISATRAAFSYPIIVGYSAHSISEADEAARAGADLILLAPIFQPLSKDSSMKPLGPQVLDDAARRLSVPLFALGGISLENLGAVASSGVTGVAGITALFPEATGNERSEARAAELAEVWFESKKSAARKP